MNIEALPKILFINQENQEMQDRRIRSKVEYDTSGPNPVKKTIKKINNTIDFTQQLPQNHQINSLAYSNKLGLLVTCIKGQIIITDSYHLESLIATSDKSKISLKQVSATIDFAGKVYMTLDETKILAVNQDQFLFYDLNTQQPISRGVNEHHLRHIVFVTLESFAGWNFHSGAYLYENISNEISNPKPFEGISTCTSVNVIENHIVVCEKTNQGKDDEDTQLLVFDQTATNTLNEFTLGKFGNPDNTYLFNFTQVICIFSIKRQIPLQFSQNDQYGLVLGYYDDLKEDQDPDRRYASFLKGNLLKPGSKLHIRAFDLFLSPTEDKTFYYDQNEQKIPFQVQIVTNKMTKIIMIEHHQIAFVVDCRTPFDKLNLYTLQPAHEIKLQDKKYFKGICLMKNMLDFERKPPASDSNPTCDMICKDFEGEFMSLYFTAKETELTVRFPQSLLILGDNKISRRYAIETQDSIEEDKTEEIKKKLTEIFANQRVYRIENRKKLELNKPMGDVKKSEPVSRPKELQKPKQQQKLQEPKGEEQKTSLLGPGLNASGILKNMQQVQVNEPKQSTSVAAGSSLFGTKTQSSGISLLNKQSTGTSLFNTKPATGSGPSIYDKKPTESNPSEAKPQTGASLFSGNQGQSNPLFGTKAPQLKQTSESKPSLGIVGNTNKQQKHATGGLFGQTSENKLPESKPTNLFQISQSKPSVQNFLLGKTQEPKPISGLFGKLTEQSKPSTTGALFGSKSETEKKQVKLNIFQTSKQSSKPQEKKNGIFANNISSTFNTSSNQKTTPVSETLFNVPKPSQTVQKKKKPNKFATKSEEIVSLAPLQLNQSKPKESIQQKSYQVKPKQIQQKSVSKSQAPKVQLKRQPIQQKKPINLDKLKQLGSFFGYTSTESIPAPLMNLTDQQIDALITQMSLVIPKKQPEPQKSREQIARQKLLKEEHFTKIVEHIDNTKSYLKTLKQANQAITSPTLFTLNNAKQLIKSTSQIKERFSEELKSKNPLSNLVKNYTQRMQFLQKQYLNLDEEVQNKNPNNRRALEEYKKMKQQKIIEGLQEIQQKIQCVIVYEQKVYTDKRFFYNFNKNTENLEQKLTDLVKEKAEKCNHLIKNVGKLLQELDEEPEKSIKSNSYSLRSSSILTNASKHNKKIGHFAFSLESSGSSDEERLNIVNQRIENQNFIEQVPKKTAKVLIKFKPKAIDMTDHNAKNFTPLVKLSELSAPLHQNNNEFNAANLFRASIDPLQNSMKKSINFKDKIPLKKDERQGEQKMKKIMKFGYSEDLQDGNQRKERFQFDYDENSSEQRDDFVPDMSRSISKIHPQGLLPRKEEEKPMKQLPKTTGLQIKKTREFDLPESSQPQDKIKIAASVFGVPNSKVQSQQTKKQSPSRFGSVTNSLLLNTKGSEVKSDKFGEVKNKQSQTGIKTGLFDSKKVETDTKAQVKKEQKSGTLFGNVGALTSGGLFGSSTNLGSKPEDIAKTKIGDKKQGPKVFQANKQEPKVEKKQTAGLFGLPSTSLFGSRPSSSLFTNLASKPNPQTIPTQSSTKLSQTAPKSTQKLPENSKRTDEDTAKQEKKDDKIPTTLLGSQNKNTLFGNNTSTLLSKKQEPKKQETTETKPATQLPKNTSAFGSGESSSLFGTGGGLFGQNNAKKQEESKPKTQASQTSKPAEQPKAQGNLFGVSSSNDQKDKQEKNPVSSTLAFGKQSNIQPKSQIAPSTKPANQTQPAVTQQTPNTLFGNNAPSGNICSQQTSNQSSLSGGLMSQSKPAQTFGATNRFMAQQSQVVQLQQTQAFNPNAVNFGENSGFSQPANTGIKTFSSFGGNQSGGMFGQIGNNQTQGTLLFGQTNNTGNSMANSMTNPLVGQTNNQSIFSSMQPGQGMFGQQNAGIFSGQNQQQQQNQGGNSNFLSGFNPNQQPAMNVPMSQGTAPNASLYKARK